MDQLARKLLRRDDMYSCIELAGFAAAQVVCCLFDRQPFIPLGFARHAGGRRSVSILESGSPQMIATCGRQWLDANTVRADDAVVAMDGYVTLPPAARIDAIILELCAYGGRPLKMRMAVPYRPHHHPNGFAVHRPKFIVGSLADLDGDTATAAFFRGVNSHEYGACIWQQCADQSC